MDLIINADDLGINPAVNEAIFKLIERGLVTSSTMLANGPDVEEACERVQSFPSCSFGVHLNITEFNTVSGSPQLGPILDENGAFDQQRTRGVAIDDALSQGIFDEFYAQISKLQSLGVPISHIDSHHYVLSIPKLFPILKRIQKAFGIRKVRISRNLYADGLVSETGLTPFVLGLDPNVSDRDVPTTLRLKKWAYNFLLKHYYRTTTTDGFSGFRMFYEYAKLRKMRHRTFEVNVHPENPYYDSGEYETLVTQWRDNLSFPVRLISYHELN